MLLPKDTTSSVLSLKAKGRSATQISEDLGVHVSTVYRRLSNASKVSSEKMVVNKKTTSYTLTKDQHADLQKICYLLQVSEKDAMTLLVNSFAERVIETFREINDESL